MSWIYPRAGAGYLPVEPPTDRHQRGSVRSVHQSRFTIELIPSWDPSHDKRQAQAAIDHILRDNGLDNWPDQGRLRHLGGGVYTIKLWLPTQVEFAICHLFHCDWERDVRVLRYIPR